METNSNIDMPNEGIDMIDSGPAGSTSFLNPNPDCQSNTLETSPSKLNSVRNLTFRDYGERIKELEGDNFQLKLRIHLMEQARFGRKGINQQNQQQGTLAGQAQGGITIANEFLAKFQQLQSSNEMLNLKLNASENQLKNLQEDYQKMKEEKDDLHSTNLDLNNRLDTLSREVALLEFRKEEDEIEKCAKTAFNLNSNRATPTPTFEQHELLMTTIKEQKDQIQSLKDEIEILQLEIAGLKNDLLQKGIENENLQQKTQKSHEEMRSLKAQKDKLDSKFSRMTEAFSSLGTSYNKLSDEHKIIMVDNEEMKITISSLNNQLEELSKMNHRLKVQKAALEDKVRVSDLMHIEYKKIVGEFKTLRSVCPVDETYEKFVNLDLRRSVSHQDIREDPSPDLGIETDQDPGVLQISSTGTLSTKVSSNSNQGFSKHNSGSKENRDLKAINTELANKLKHTKQALDKTLSRLDKTSKEKEQFEKAICRQLHRTHNLLQDANQSLAETQGVREEVEFNKNMVSSSSSAF